VAGIDWSGWSSFVAETDLAHDGTGRSPGSDHGGMPPSARASPAEARARTARHHAAESLLIASMAL
jgi:hypothetical protein